MHRILPLLLAISSLLYACDSHQKVMKSDDLDYKYAMAEQYYSKKSFFKAIPIYEELMGIYKGTKATEDIYFKYCQSLFGQRNYLLAAYHFKNFYLQHPKNSNAEQALYMQAQCYVEMSPKSNLEQTYTLKALEAYQYFINTFPSSEKMPEINNTVDELRRKLEVKALDNANLYYNTENYRAAATAYKNMLVEYPDIEEAEEINFKALKSSFKFAENSISSKKAERYEEVIEVYNQFVRRYPESKYIKEAKQLKEDAHFLIIQSRFNAGLSALLRKKNELFSNVIKDYNNNVAYLNTDKLKKEAEDIVESAQYQMIRSNYEIAQDAPKSQKERLYKNTIKSYYNFVDKYKNSRYFKEAEKLYNATLNNLNKIKTNG